MFQGAKIISVLINPFKGPHQGHLCYSVNGISGPTDALAPTTLKP